MLKSGDKKGFLEWNGFWLKRVVYEILLMIKVKMMQKLLCILCKKIVSEFLGMWCELKVSRKLCDKLMFLYFLYFNS